MTPKTQNLHVALGASQVRRRLKGHGFGVKKVETAGNNRAVIVHTATGEHLRQLEALFQDVIEARSRRATAETLRLSSVLHPASELTNPTSSGPAQDALIGGSP
jgi:hypothetical protein